MFEPAKLDVHQAWFYAYRYKAFIFLMTVFFIFVLLGPFNLLLHFSEFESCFTWMQAEASSHSLPISTTKSNSLGQRARTAAFVDWIPQEPWKWRTEEQESPDISSVVREVLSLPGWRAGNALTLIIKERRLHNGPYRSCEV
jgi:hypothetical protein